MNNLQEYRDFFLKCIPAHKKESWILNHYPIFHRYLKINYQTAQFNVSLYHFLNNLNDIPTCKMCDKTVRFIGLKMGYSIYCSKICARSDKEVINKFLASCEKTNLERHGVKFAWQARKTKDSIKQTNLEKFGVENVFQSEEIKDKIKKTNLKRLGVSHPLKSIKIKNKIKETNLKKFGVENVAQSEEVKDKIKKTNLKKYGVEYGFQSKEVKDKIKETNLEKFGVENVFQSEEVKNKIKKTNLKKYGVEYPQQSNIIRKKIEINQNIKYVNQYKNFLRKINYSILQSKKHKLTIKCDNNHISKISKKLFQKRITYNVTICPICNDPAQKHTSDFHIQISKFVEQYYNIILNDRKILSTKELDIYIPELKIAIECNGVYWHNELYKNSNYHLNKYLECEKKGIKLIQIWEDDWKYKQNIIKSRLLNILNKTNNTVYARKCDIKEIDSTTYNTFIEENHLQGKIQTKYKIGLYYTNELISVMSFSNKNTKMKLERFCSKLNLNVVGGASKLFKYFINKYNPNQILTYSNLDWSKSNFYEKLNFKFVCNTTPGYWYLVDGIKRNRFLYNKQKLVLDGYDSNKTEFEIMAERKIPKIWNSGNAKWIWQK